LSTTGLTGLLTSSYAASGDGRCERATTRHIDRKESELAPDWHRTSSHWTIKGGIYDHWYRKKAAEHGPIWH